MTTNHPKCVFEELNGIPSQLSWIFQYSVMMYTRYCIAAKQYFMKCTYFCNSLYELSGDIFCDLPKMLLIMAKVFEFISSQKILFSASTMYNTHTDS